MLISAPLCFFCGGRTARRVRARWCALPWLGTKMRKSDVTVPGALYSEPGSRRMEGGRRREEGENEIGKGSRQRGRERGDSVITFTLPDTAVRLTFDSYPQPLCTPLSQYLTLSICLSLLSLFTESKQKLELSGFVCIEREQRCFSILLTFCSASVDSWLHVLLKLVKVNCQICGFHYVAAIEFHTDMTFYCLLPSAAYRSWDKVL